MSAATLTARPRGPLKGRVRAPGDKSISHRALILGALAEGVTHIDGLLQSDDVLATAEAVARACVTYATLACQKKLHSVYTGNIATFAVYAVNGGRHVGGHQNSRDVLSPVAKKKKNIRVVTLSPWSKATSAPGVRVLATEERLARSAGRIPRTTTRVLTPCWVPMTWPWAAAWAVSR